MTTTVLLVDNHPLFRKVIRLLLEEEPDMSVVGEAGDGKEAIERVRELSPDVVVMGISMPNLNGIEATRQILSDSPNTKVVAMSINFGKRFVKDMLSAGASGYILKDNVLEEITNGIRKVMQEEVYLSGTITSAAVSEFLAGGIEQSTSEASGQWAADEAASILRTKLHRPPILPDFVPRADMVAQLEMLRLRPATFISAPAGFGKSTMASLWLEAWDGPYAWVSLNEEENDLAMFLTYLLAAIRKAFPGACTPTRSLLQAKVLPPLPVLSRYFLNDLDEIEEPFILVLDDYQNIREKTVHDLLAAILNHPPQNLHLMIVTRYDQPLISSTLRGRGQVNEIGRFDLQFTAAETAIFLKNTLKLAVDRKTAAAIQEKLEGWPAGMRLMSQSLKSSADLDHLLAGLEGGFAAIVDYLVAEVLSQQSAEMTESMVAISILNRFCAPLCDALRNADSETGEHWIDGAALIAKLQKDNLFLIALDSENRWFRYHHLFQDFLRSELQRRCSSQEVAELHSRAGRWFAEHGLIEETLRHVLTAGDTPQAIKLLELNRHQFMNQEQWQRHDRLIQLLPAEIIAKTPTLLISKAWSAEYQSRAMEAYAYRDQVDALISQSSDESSENNTLRGEIDALHSHQQYLSAKADNAIASAERALRLLPPDAHSVRACALGYMAFALQMRGDFNQGVKLIRQTLESEPLNGDKFRHGRLLTILCYLNFMEGNLTELKQTALQCLKLGEKLDLPESICWSRYWLGSLHYLRNELPEAVHYLAPVVDNPFTSRPLYVAQSAFALALSYTAQGHCESAQRVAESVVSFAAEIDGALERELARAFLAELACRQGRLFEADRWAQQYNPHPMVFMVRLYIPQLTLVKVLLAKDTDKTRSQAADFLLEIQDFCKSIHHKRVLIDVTALQAMLHDQQGEESAAFNKLTEALALALPGGFIRSFVDLGAPMADLLKRLQEQNVAVDYLDKLLAAFKEDAQRSAPVATDSSDPPPLLPVSPSPSPPVSPFPPLQVPPTPQPLVEPLSHREREVLELLAQRQQYKEIAEILFISKATVKSHLRNIYRKLDVHKRSKAVEKAHALGVLGPDKG